jgi:excisionase family DNA binding protein
VDCPRTVFALYTSGRVAITGYPLLGLSVSDWRKCGGPSPHARRRQCLIGGNSAVVGRGGNVMQGGSNKLLNVNEVADLLGVVPDTIYRKWQSWGMNAYRVGERLRFREREIAAWIDRNRM